MIKIFGKVRYHWQPELSWSIIYWSITFIPIFIAMSLFYERGTVPIGGLSFIAVFMIFVGFGFHRYFIISEDNKLWIISLNILKPLKVDIASIKKVEVTKTTLALVFEDGKSRLFHMRKWPKKYFIDALALNPAFKGEVELLDHLDSLDYFKFYQNDKKEKASLRNQS
ncbi:EbsA family protein [Streptococcus dentapri]|uniref:EbsA family protein n=1 Tax=Streptococcus dentapri TaxID=573564 RepID=A0ABV8CZK0_9STRE